VLSFDESTDAVSVGFSKLSELDSDTAGTVANDTGTADRHSPWWEREREHHGASLSRFSTRFDKGSPAAEDGHLAVYSPAGSTFLEHDVRQDGLGTVKLPPPVSSIYSHCRRMPAEQPCNRLGLALRAEQELCPATKARSAGTPCRATSPMMTVSSLHSRIGGQYRRRGTVRVTTRGIVNLIAGQMTEATSWVPSHSPGRPLDTWWRQRHYARVPDLAATSVSSPSTRPITIGHRYSRST
jgi:hypothetical protein